MLRVSVFLSIILVGCLLPQESQCASELKAPPTSGDANPTLQSTLNALEQTLEEFSTVFVLRSRTIDPKKYFLDIEIKNMENVADVKTLAASTLKGNSSIVLSSVGARIGVRGLEEYWQKMRFLEGGSLLAEKLEEILQLENRPNDLDRLCISIADAGMSVSFGDRSSRKLALEKYRKLNLKMPTLEVHSEKNWWTEPTLNSEASEAFYLWQSHASRTYDEYVRKSSDSYSMSIQRWTEQWMGLMARFALESNFQALQEIEGTNPDFLYYICPFDRPASEMFYYNIQTLGIDGGHKLYDEFFDPDA